MDNPVNKVFGVGLSRTGTTSLNRALELLGIPSVHYPHDEITQAELLSNSRSLTILKHYSAITDISTVPFYKNLDAAYPGSRFILTVRDIEPWLISMQYHLQRMQKNYDKFDEQFWTFTEVVCELVWGGLYFDKVRFRQAYERHNESVKKYFQERPQDLLVLDITKGGGWNPLCKFLDCKVPGQPFPNENRNPALEELNLTEAKSQKNQPALR